MHGQPHLSRRGAAYQWRCRIRVFSTKFVDLKLSLGTMDRRVAIILARKISAESDTFMDGIIRTEISPQEARVWLADVIKRERAKIEKLQMLRRFDSLDPLDDVRHDEATRDAWVHLARSGMNAEAPEDASELLSSTIDLYRRDLTSESRRRIIAREFQDLTGRPTSSAFEIVTLMSLLISGKRAAWSGEDAALEPIDALADTLAAQTPSDLLGPEPPCPAPNFSPDNAARTPPAVSLPADKVGLSTGTINRHLDHLGQVTNWAADEGFLIDPRLDPGKLRCKETVRESEKKDAFTLPQLKALFQSPVWTGSETEYYQTRPGKSIYRNGIYWCLLIGGVTGARREEIAGASPEDIIEVDGMSCISIRETEQRHVKTLSSCRIVPIHARLIELGFLDHVTKMKRAGHPDLFPDLREPKSGKHGKKLGRRMRQIIDDTLGAGGAAISFHSFRHYVQNALEHAAIDDKIIRDIVGHEGRDIHEKTYHKPTPPNLMRPAIDALPLWV